MLPQSKGLMSPLLSPDGNYIVALSMSGEGTAVLLDLKAGTRTELVKSGLGSLVGWSRDSRYFYYCHLGEASLEIYRLAISNRKVEAVGNLVNLRLVNGLSGYWMGLAPDESPMFARDVGTRDIYALDWEAP